ncbi:ATP-binding protein [Vibrio breoganii]|uniref:ATP-dependent nuclease n=1 Tax=Vibrio breoganii TaxID=553239 RepID=UPI0010BD8CC3|nr:AAA family ATPase [Vibrio breoganii]TKG25126.1 ATP-binding protein [Vibrio breoganii]
MEIIKSIQVRKFRSLKSVTKKLEFSELNIFVGQNDQGKSNLLRALNLFFNNETDMDTRFRFSEDYCYHSNRGKGTRHEIRIDLVIHPPKHRFKHAKPLRWVKRWRQDGSIVEERKYIESGKDVPPRDGVSQWLDKIRYRYIPAIKGQSYFSALMGELHDVLNEAHAETLSTQGEEFIRGIQNVTQDITRDLSDQIGISNTIQVPSDFKQLFSNLDFGVRLGSNTYHLKQRGDGIKIRHIPVILKYMSEQERNISRAGYVKPDTIWGFEEPENNLELRYAFELAKTFKAYSKDIQIFVTTHSPAFYALDQTESDGVNTFYISQGEDNCTQVDPVSHDDTDDLHESMGLLPIITPYLSKIYAHQNEIENLKSRVEELEDTIKYVVLTEDENHEHVIKYFKAQGCNLDVTEFYSYFGADQINAAIVLGKYLKSKRPDITVIIHRDRDYHDDKKIDSIRRKIEKNGFVFFVTKGVDLEGEYICPNHINAIYPDITVERAQELIEAATEKVKDSSIDRLIDQDLKSNKPEQLAYAKQIRKLTQKYD